MCADKATSEHVWQGEPALTLADVAGPRQQSSPLAETERLKRAISHSYTAEPHNHTVYSPLVGVARA
jgi:hypothetical protein